MHRTTVLARIRILIAAAMLCGLLTAIPAQAQPATLAWEGQTWTVSDNASAVVDTNGYAVLTRTTGTAEASLHVNRLLPTDENDVSFINEFGTPWVEVTWEDNGAQKGVDVFIDDEGHPQNPRIQFGSLFNCEGIAYTKYEAVEETTLRAGEGCDVQGNPGSRVAGDVHTLYAGKRADGTIDYRFDGVWYTSTLLADAGITDFEFGDVYLRLRESEGTTAIFHSITYGNDHTSDNIIGDRVSQLREDTIELVSNPAAQRALVATVDRLQRAIDAGNPFAAYVTLLQYVIQLNAYTRSHAVTPQAAQQLVAEAHQIFTSLFQTGPTTQPLD